MILIFCMCEDEKQVTKFPSIQFKLGEEYTSKNDSAKFQDSLKIGIMAESGNKGNLILFEIFKNEETVESIDINRATLDADILILKDTLFNEYWKFLVRDKSNRADSISILFTLDTLSI